MATAIYLTEYTREGRLTAVIRFGADCLAGIPSIIFGLFGFVFFVITLGMGLSILSGALTLALMVLPTIIRTSEEAIRAVPQVYRDVSYGLGSTRWQMVTRVVLRSALPGIGTGIVLSLGPQHQRDGGGHAHGRLGPGDAAHGLRLRRARWPCTSTSCRARASRCPTPTPRPRC